MTEKLDTGLRNVLNTILPQGWGFLYIKGSLVVYDVMPQMELVKIVSQESVLEGKKEIFYKEMQYFCLHFSKSFYHWQADCNSVIYTTGAIKGTLVGVIVTAQDYSMACNVFAQIRKKVFSAL